MEYLLDTHMAIWSLFDDEKLPKIAYELINNNENIIYVSSVSTLEIAVKRKSHPEQMPIDSNKFVYYCKEAGFKTLPITKKHIIGIDSLEYKSNKPRHKDFMDKLLISQAKEDGMLLITHDHLMKNYNENCLLIL